MFRALKVALVIVFCLFFLYAADYASLRYRIPNNRVPFGTVAVSVYYAVPQKNGKTEFLFDHPEDQTCVQSLFPHLGYNPCWYVNRHKQRRINL